MQSLEYLAEFAFARQALVAAIFIATASAALSPIVVLKRLAFVGQGISHSAFGGIGIVVIFGLAGLFGEAVIFGFCLASALLIAHLTSSRTREDAAIGIVLVGTMALGFLLIGLRTHMAQYEWYRAFIAGAPTVSGWETILFGSVMIVGPLGAWMSGTVTIITLSCLWWWRRPLAAYVFDETAAEAAGVNTKAIRNLLMVLLALVVVVGMKLVGVVLISAMLVLPGAIAARLARTLPATFLICWLAAIIGVVGGLVIAFEFEAIQAGPAIVLVLVIQFAIAAQLGRR